MPSATPTRLEPPAGRQAQGALEHFREALRLEPEMDFARAGIVEAMKSKNWFYALMLRYFLWMGRLSSTAQWMIILGGYFGYQGLLRLAKEYPKLAPWIIPILIAYVIFALMTWIAPHLFNLLFAWTAMAGTLYRASR